MNTRNLMIAGAAVVVLAGAGVGWFYYGQPRKPPPRVTGPVTIAELMVPNPLGEQVLGKDDAPVTIIEYASMTCPHCAQFHETTYPEMKKRYIDTGQVRFIFREFPLDATAATASMLARCTGKDRFFPLIEVLFKQQNTWATASPRPLLLAIAKQAGFTEESFDACLNNQKVFDGIKWSYERASQLGVQSTPSFFINGKFQPGGVMTIERLEKLLEPLLKS